VATRELILLATRDSGISFDGVPVLLYHGLHCGSYAGDPSLAKYSIYESRFAEQLNQVRHGEYRVALLRELWAEGGLKNRRLVVITFDDGRTSDYEIALPTLLGCGFCADFFVNTSLIGKPGFLNWRQIEEMHRVGMGIHSHSHDHVVLSQLSRPVLMNQLRRSKQLLEERVGVSIEFLSAPYGVVNRRVVETALEIGYKAVCHSINWPAQPGARLIPRISVYADTPLGEFARFLRGAPAPYLKRAIQTAANYVPKRLLLRYYPALLGVRVLETRA
jgi:peptidoglycan/xylan/chitin deacetylase (PgdA/CDA1 family)